MSFLKDKGIAGRNYLWYIKHPIHGARWIYRYYWGNFRNMVERGRKGYGYEDVWSLDSYILSWLPDALREVAKDQGYPGSYNDASEWQAYLHETADLFEDTHKRMFSYGEGEMLTDEDYERFYKAWKKLGKNFFSLWT